MYSFGTSVSIFRSSPRVLRAYKLDCPSLVKPELFPTRDTFETFFPIEATPIYPCYHGEELYKLQRLKS